MSLFRRRPATVDSSPEFVESLEARTLMAFSAHINFQPITNTDVPPGYKVDYGAAYGMRKNRLTYGWAVENIGMARDRDSSKSTSQKWDTLNHMQFNGANLTWSIKLPKGDYTVHVAAGDPDFPGGVTNIKVEGKSVVSGTTTSDKPFLDGSVTVNVADGKLTLSNGFGATDNKLCFVDITPAATLPVTPGEFFDGVALNVQSDPAKTIPILRNLGARGVRLWCNLDSWDERTIRAEYSQIQQYHDAGFLTVLLIQTTKIPTYSQAKSFYDFVQNLPGMRAAVDWWEVGNEPNIVKYFKGTLPQYVNQELRAAWDSLHATGETVVGAGLTPDRNQVKYLISLGYMKYIDYANIHPYLRSVADQQALITDVVKYFAGKPVMATEWNFQLVQNDPNWAKKLAQEHPFVVANLKSAFYYKFVYDFNSMAGPAGLIDSNYQAHQPFYDLYQLWHL